MINQSSERDICYICIVNTWYMGNWSEKQEIKKEGKEKDKVRREKLAGFFFNLAQVSFTILSLGLSITLVKEELYDNIILMVLVSMGVVLTVLFAKIGNNILR